MSISSIIVLALLVFVAVTIFKGVRIVPQGYKWIVQRLGKYHSTLNPGLNFVIPYIDEVAYKVTIFEGTDLAIPKLREFGQAIGLAFQVQDDILDIISDTEVLGKTAGKDEQVEKSTYPALMGLEQAKQYAKQLHDQALNALAHFEGQAEELTQITQFLLHRKS